MVAKLWKLTLFMNDGSERLIALYDDEGEALIDAIELSEDSRVLGYRIKPEVHERGERWDGKYYMAFVWIDRYQDWECYGYFPSYEAALHECERIMSIDKDARDFEIRVEAMKYDIDNGAYFKENFADSMDQSCPGEIHVKGFPADCSEAKREYEKAAKDFCIDNLSCFDK